MPDYAEQANIHAIDILTEEKVIRDLVNMDEAYILTRANVEVDDIDINLFDTPFMTTTLKTSNLLNIELNLEAVSVVDGSKVSSVPAFKSI